MKDNKGFTLVELLAVIVILGSISLVTVVGISNSLEKRNQKECEEQIELAKNAAKIYFSLREAKCSDGSSPCVEVQTLIDEGYFDDGSKINKISGGVIKLDSNSYKYEGGDGECKE